eukprot:TRINITY_DN66500_c11_g1_i1.p1 TRINITY_DN66500_c11_g1~~TRINITY_DN66500_c11_g1_i1.p1  ORF type:complete len:225 (-),score=2.06 TRINITY_DN66500_c11_g1_i1:41-715(-)
MDLELVSPTDLTLRFKDEVEVKVHANVMQECSGFFRAMYKSGMKEATSNQVELEEPSEEWKPVLKILYHQIAIQEEDIEKLLPLVDKYEIHSLAPQLASVARDWTGEKPLAQKLGSHFLMYGYNDIVRPWIPTAPSKVLVKWMDHATDVSILQIALKEMYRREQVGVKASNTVREVQALVQAGVLLTVQSVTRWRVMYVISVVCCANCVEAYSQIHKKHTPTFG